MKMVRSSLLRGAALSTFPLLWACSGTMATNPSSAERADPLANESSAIEMDRTQDPQGMSTSAEQRALLVSEGLGRARNATEQGQWNDARREAGYVLELDQNSDEARRILLSAHSMLGSAADSEPVDKVLQARISLELDREKAIRESQLGDALMEQSKPGDALDHYETALLILKFNPFAAPGSSLRKAMEIKVGNARQLKARMVTDTENAQQAASRRDLDAEESRARASRRAQVERLMEQANRDFQLGNFSGSVKLLDTALRLEPNHASARTLRDLASRADHNNRIDVAQQRWKAEWSKTFDDLNSSYKPQTNYIEYDLERWALVLEREPITFSPPEGLDSPEKRAIIAKLEATKLEHSFATATVHDWAKFYQGVTDVNFLVSSDVAELDEDTTSLTDFNLSNRSVASALEVIAAQTGVKWRVKNGLVELVTGENATGDTYLSQYEVRDLVLGVHNNPGIELKLSAGTFEDDPIDEDDPLPQLVDESKLQDMIRNNIASETWDGTPGTISYLNGVLLVRHTQEIHQQIISLLADLRQSVGTQVDIETRFLKVEDNFLEDIGVDFRGLGDHAADGIAGRGLERNARSGLRFDDFGRPELINTATPGNIGTGTEPGVFFDDGGDGDLLARTENLFDTTLGRGQRVFGDSLVGGEGGISNAGGLGLQFSYLDDVELEIVLRAVSKQERNEEIISPRLLVYNNTRANMSVLRHTSYIKDFDVEIAQSAAVANPVVAVISDGVVLDVRPVVSADRRFITMELRPTLMDLQLPIPTFTTTLGAGQPVSIQLPIVTLQKVRTTITMPDGGTVLLGGMKLAEKQDQVSGVPFLKDLPGLSLLFSRKGKAVLNRRVLILIKGTIIIPSEHEPEFMPNEAEQFLSVR